MDKKKVLLTGITGFLGSHTAIQLLEKGYEVIGTLRNMERANSIREVIAKKSKHTQYLRFAEADLKDTDIWLELSQGVDYIQHIASPFPRTLPKKEEELLLPAKEGTLNILRAASANKVKRVVITSSIAAIVYGKSKMELDKVFDERDWTDETNKSDSSPYFRSKTVAERAAWEFLSKDRSRLEISTVLPGAILGPVLEEDFGTSANIVIKMLDGSSPALPKIGFDIVDVRSVADLLIRAMEMPQAANKRYIASAGYFTFKEISQVLRQHYPFRKIPHSELPNFAVRLFSLFDPSVKPILVDLGIKRKTAIDKAIKELQWQPLSAREAILSCAKSVLEAGIVK